MPVHLLIDSIPPLHVHSHDFREAHPPSQHPANLTVKINIQTYEIWEAIREEKKKSVDSDISRFKFQYQLCYLLYVLFASLSVGFLICKKMLITLSLKAFIWLQKDVHRCSVSGCSLPSSFTRNSWFDLVTLSSALWHCPSRSTNPWFRHGANSLWTLGRVPSFHSFFLLLVCSSVDLSSF